MLSAKILIEISKVVRSLLIVQTSVTEIEDGPYFFGQLDQDWAPIICDMFSNKLDKLFIRNVSCPEYLSDKGAAFLKEVALYAPYMFRLTYFLVFTGARKASMLQNVHSSNY